MPYNKKVMKFKRIFPHILFVLLAGFFFLLNSFSLKQSKVIQSLPAKNQISISKETARIEKVVDGDTIRVLIGSKEDVVRLIGIDSPEVLDERKPIQCFGKEASDKAKEILNGKVITLESDPTQKDRDEYGRLLRYVFLEDGTNFNKLMISEGYSREYTFKGNSYKYQSEFIQAEKTAEKDKEGLWGSCSN